MLSTVLWQPRRAVQYGERNDRVLVVSEDWSDWKNMHRNYIMSCGTVPQAVR